MRTCAAENDFRSPQLNFRIMRVEVSTLLSSFNRAGDAYDLFDVGNLGEDDFVGGSHMVAVRPLFRIPCVIRVGANLSF